MPVNPNTQGLFQWNSNNAGAVVSMAGSTQKISAIIGGKIIVGPVVSAGQWYHVALVRASGVDTLYINGVAQGTQSETSTQSAASGWPRIGYNSSQNFNGWIDEFRLSNGIARWLANFTPPTAAYY
jgi:hypothetical protein